MASAAKFRPLYAKAAALWGRWRAAHDAGARLLRAAGNVLSRLPAMADPAAYGALAGDGPLQEAALGAQLEALEGLLASVRRSLCVRPPAVCSPPGAPPARSLLLSPWAAAPAARAAHTAAPPPPPPTQTNPQR